MNSILFKYYFISILTLLYRPIRGSAKPIQLHRDTWVVINVTSNIGDMVCTTPVFRAIKNANPRARVVVVGTEKNRSMVEGNTDVDRYVSIDHSLWNVYREIRAEKVQNGIIINFSALDFGLLFLAGVSALSSFKFTDSRTYKDARAYRVLSKFGFQVGYVPGTYVPGQYLKLLEPFGIISSDIQKRVVCTSEALDGIREKISNARINEKDIIIAIAPGAGTKIKQWPAERFGEITNYLNQKYSAGVVIIGGPNDIPESERMLAVLKPDVRYVNTIGCSLDELKAVLSQVALIIGNDSGPIYIAESYGSATLVLVGPTDDAEHPLNDRTHKVVMALERGRALLQSAVSAEDTIDLVAARAQIEAITVDQVTTEIDNLFVILKIESKA